MRIMRRDFGARAAADDAEEDSVIDRTELAAEDGTIPAEIVVRVNFFGLVFAGLGSGRRIFRGVLLVFSTLDRLPDAWAIAGSTGTSLAKAGMNREKKKYSECA